MMKDLSDEYVVSLFSSAMNAGWNLADAGCIEAATRAYEFAESVCPIPGMSINPPLSLLRHIAGRVINPTHVVMPQPYGHNEMMIYRPGISTVSPNADGLLSLPPIDKNRLRQSISALSTFEALNPGPRRRHAMILSTGRCGTVSLAKLFAESNLEAYHSYWWQVAISTRWWMMAALMTGHDPETPGLDWARTRTAEWLGAKPMLGCSHLDTVFAPVFAAIHPDSTFLYIHREPEAIFASFYGKDQWREDNQLRPVRYCFDNGRFIYFAHEMPLIDKLAWYIRFTEAFCEAFGEVYPDRFLRIEAESMFAQDRATLLALLSHLGSDVTLDRAIEHFAAPPINEKSQKRRLDPSVKMSKFQEAYRRLL